MKMGDVTNAELRAASDRFRATGVSGAKIWLRFMGVDPVENYLHWNFHHAVRLYVGYPDKWAAFLTLQRLGIIPKEYEPYHEQLRIAKEKQKQNESNNW